MKLAVVGGGSTYTPELIDGFARLRDALPVTELVLIDPATERLELIGALARRIFARQDHPGRITWTDDLDAGLDGADAVLLQLRVGGQAARNQDETWPLECGCVGQETTGAGGLAKALRTVPVVLDIAERVRRRCPDAWIVDFTNPVGIVTRALLNHGHKAVGLCNVAIGFQRKFAKLLNVAPERVELEHVGLNHLTWERAVRVDGEDVLPKLLAEHGDAVAADLRMPRPLLDHLGVVPSYYLRYYYQHDAVVEELRTKPSRAAEVAAIERQLLDLYADPTLAEKPELLASRGGAFYSEAAVALTSSLLGGGGGGGDGHGGGRGDGPGRGAAGAAGDATARPAGDVQIVNTLNNGTLPFLPDDAVIEVPAAVGPRGASPLPLRPLAPLFAGLVANVTAYEHLALEAALKGGRDRVFSALLAHPLIGQIDYANRLTDELIAHNLEHLTWA
ncbi:MULTISPECIES: 6-phospho-beta-glucosidase [unclassified Streptomyces]|uniref:6-phospho-beta-glucosidase n=1 Tax=unclassified Streptomyces TaxID=2593676 RepID=UPI000C27DDB8|nr:6-phospho-beta-glucosidase [Streptomyces sp. CB02959]PJN38876.1 6-phospho-beta-glucosidase [Streptomyces sp. CB02959]